MFTRNIKVTQFQHHASQSPRFNSQAESVGGKVFDFSFDTTSKTSVVLLLMALLVLTFQSGCRPDDKSGSGFSRPKPPASAVNRVIAVSYPLHFLTEKIAPKKVKVEFPIAQDAEPRNWKPDRKAIGQMQSADLIVVNGIAAPYAKWIDRVALPESKVCSTATKGLLSRDYIGIEDVTITHSHGPEGEHSHQMMVSRTWLDPTLAKKQVKHIAERLMATYPKSADAIEANLASLNDELDALIGLVDGIKASEPGGILTATPELKFLTRAVGLTDLHMVWGDDVTAEQAAKDLDKALATLKKNNAKKAADQKEIAPPKAILFGGKGPSPEIQKLLDERGLEIINISLIDKRPEYGSYLTELRDSLGKLQNALKAE